MVGYQSWTKLPVDYICGRITGYPISDQVWSSRAETIGINNGGKITTPSKQYTASFGVDVLIYNWITDMPEGLSTLDSLMVKAGLRGQVSVGSPLVIPLGELLKLNERPQNMIMPFYLTDDGLILYLNELPGSGKRANTLDIPHDDVGLAEEVLEAIVRVEYTVTGTVIKLVGNGYSINRV